RAVGSEPTVAREAPGAVDENPDADAFALDVVDAVDRTVSSRDHLRAADDRPRVCIRGARIERGGDRFFAEVPHGPEPYLRTGDRRGYNPPRALVAELV